MAQANVAQREPSMEEILASIRRIIEDSDTVRKTPDEERARDAASLRAEAANTQPPLGASEPAEVQNFRHELRGESGSVRHEPDFGTVSDDERDEAELDALELEAAFAAIDAAAEAPAAATPPQPAGVRQEPAALASDPRPVASSSAERSEERRPAIISEVAGRQVAAAFEELSAAFSASRSRSFDEMAEEMVRPMLQDWLDNNLPTLVERLVREEIERIARGGAG